MLADKRFGKALLSLQACVLVNNNLLGKLVSPLELPIKFHERFKVASVTLFIPDFDILSRKLHIFIFKVLYSVILC